VVPVGVQVRERGDRLLEKGGVLWFLVWF
jgi:hypothetical protein